MSPYRHDHENDDKKSRMLNFWQSFSKPAEKTKHNSETPVKNDLLDQKLEFSIFGHYHFQK